MIANSQQRQSTLQRIAWCQDQVRHLRKAEPNHASYLAATSGFRTEIKQLHKEVCDYFSAFRASRGSNLELRDAIDLVREVLPASQADVVAEHLLPSARIVVHDDANPAAGTNRSHYGGVPLMPRGMEWPVWDKTDYLTEDAKRFEARRLPNVASRKRQELSQPIAPLLFLGQFYLAEIHAVAPLPNWPAEGTLAIFYEPSAAGFDPLCQGHCRALYFREDEPLVPVPHHAGLASKSRFPHRALSLRKEWTLPSSISIDGTELSVLGRGSESYKALCDGLMSITDEREPIHRFGGRPQEIQGQDMRLECQLVSNGIYCGDMSGYKDPRRSILEKDARDWRLLVQIDSDEKRLGWMWGDVGRVYFWARWQDIQAKRFEHSWAIEQSY
jgi:uncharacterized protein YwqG